MGSDVSSYDKVTMFVAVLALATSLISTYFQLFHKSTDFEIGHVALTDSWHTADSLYYNSDTLFLDMDLMMLNTGDNDVALVEWFTYINTTGEVPSSSSIGNNFGNIPRSDPRSFTFFTSVAKKQIFRPNTIDFLSLPIGIDIQSVIKICQIDTSNFVGKEYDLYIGAEVDWVDSEGVETTTEIKLDPVQITIQKIGDYYRFGNYSAPTQELSKKAKKVY